MKIALLGATGNVGSRILVEALRRGHDVTAIVRTPTKLKPQAKLTVEQGDVENTERLVEILKGQDLLISSYTPTRGTPNYTQTTLAGYHSIVEAAKKAHIRLLIVGGAGSLLLPNGTALVDDPHFPAEYKTEASTFRDILESLRKEKNLDWTYLSPAAFFGPGERTGKFRLGGDAFLTDSSGKSQISMEDYAVALLNEAEKPAHPRQRFCVAY